MMGAMIVSPRTEHAVARSLAETTDPHAALARALSTIGESLGWQLGAAWEPAADRPEALVCEEVWHGGDAPAVAFEQASRETSLAPGEGLPGRVLAQRRAGLDRRRRRRRRTSPRARPPRRAGLRVGVLLPDPQRPTASLGAIEFFTAEPREPDEELLATMASLGGQIGQFVERRRARRRVREKRGAPARDARRGARLRRHDRPRGPDRRVQRGRRAHVRLHAGGGDRPRDGRADRPARAARAPPRGPRALPRDRRRRRARPAHRDHRRCAPTAASSRSS